MIDFAHEEAELEAAVGLSTDAVLGALGEGAARQLSEVRLRFERFVQAGGPLSADARLQRDRLDSLLQHLFGPAGLLRRAGALVSLQDRLQRIAALAPRCLSTEGASDRLRRETLLARTFAREQVARGGGADTQAIAAEVARTAEALSRLDGFCAALASSSGARALNWKSLGLYSLSDVADMGNEPLGVADGIAFVLRRLADASFVRAATTELQSLCAEHASALRDLLWHAAEVGYAQRPSPATHRELTELDHALEALRGKLTQPEVDAAERCAAIAQLYALLAVGRASEASLRVERALQPIRDTLLVGLEAEATV